MRVSRIGWLAAAIAGAALAQAPESQPAASQNAAATAASAPASGPTDYVALLNAEYSKGVTTENNAALDLLEMIGPGEGGHGCPPEVFKQLKISEDGYRGKFFTTSAAYMKSYYGEDYQSDSKGKWVKEEEKTRKTLWVREDCPPIADWLKDNGWALDAAAETLAKPRFYVPLYSASKPPLLMDTLRYMMLGRWRSLGDAINSRALLRWRAGDTSGAAEDMQTELRLGQHVAMGPYWIDQLVGIAIERQVCASMVLIAREGKLSEKDARLLLEKIGPAEFADYAGAADQGERMFYIESCEQAARDPKSLLQIFSGYETPGNGANAESGDLDKVDWKAAAKVIDEIQARRVAAMRSGQFAAGKSALEKIDRELAEIGAASEAAPLPEDTDWTKVDFAERQQEGRKKMAAFLKMRPGETVDLFSKRIAQLIAFDHGTFLRGWVLNYMTRQQGDLARVAVALAGYKAANGKWPEKLAELSPKWLAELPGDYFSGKGLLYRVEKEGAVVYSVGADEKDDGGVEGKNLLSGDVVVRLK